MAEIQASQGIKFLVDDDDLALLSNFKWMPQKSGTRIYAQASIWLDGKNHNFRMHRMIINAPKVFDVDHINCNTLDNRKSNLRICTRSQNLANAKGHTDRKYDLPKGVELTISNRYRASICCDGKRLRLGCYATPQEAKSAYDKKAQELFGEYHRS